MIPVLKRKVWDWILPEYFGYLVDWTMSTFHTCIIVLLLTSKTKCCDQLKEDLLNYISSSECFLIFLCWRQENKHFVVDTLFFRKCKMTSRETETHCVGSYSSHKGSLKNPILILNELIHQWNYSTFLLLSRKELVILQSRLCDFILKFQVSGLAIATIFEEDQI